MKRLLVRAGIVVVLGSAAILTTPKEGRADSCILCLSPGESCSYHPSANCMLQCQSHGVTCVAAPYSNGDCGDMSPGELLCGYT